MLADFLSFSLSYKSIFSYLQSDSFVVLSTSGQFALGEQGFGGGCAIDGDDSGCG